MWDGGAAVAELAVVAGVGEIKEWDVGAAVVVMAGVDGRRVVDERLGVAVAAGATVVVVILVVLEIACFGTVMVDRLECDVTGPDVVAQSISVVLLRGVF